VIAAQVTALPALLGQYRGNLAQALFSYDSAASHTDPHLRDIAWSRENRVLTLGTATASPHLTSG
jgi:hypothetical protein